jgi:hypothetical protein
MQSSSSLELLMKYTALLIITLIALEALTGCSTAAPVTARFPEAPGNVTLTACPQLQKLSDDATLSDIAKTITTNYTTYHECAVKMDAWIEWYQKQKYIFENVN